MTITPVEWASLGSAEPLVQDEIRCVVARLDVDDDVLEDCRRRLAPDEVERADRFLFPRHRRRFAVARAFLRELLADHTATSATDMRFEYGLQGKPRRASDIDGLRFNLSHSGDVAIAALTREAEVGVDVEVLGRRVDLGVARRFFCSEETDEVLAHPESERHEAFLRCWTRKEAFIKAKGGGLSIPLDGFRVSVGPHSEARLVSVAWDPGEVARWHLAAFDAGHDAVGAVVVAAPGPDRLTCWSWPGFAGRASK